MISQALPKTRQLDWRNLSKSLVSGAKRVCSGLVIPLLQEHLTGSLGLIKKDRAKTKQTTHDSGYKTTPCLAASPTGGAGAQGRGPGSPPSSPQVELIQDSHWVLFM